MNDGDNVPDLAGGRIPVDTLSDAQIVVDSFVERLRFFELDAFNGDGSV